jgi:pimeloyl-ACP methyl ester carboxylesterase
MARRRAGRQNRAMFLRVDDVQLNTVAFGDRTKPVFLAHGGWVGSWELWQDPFQLMQHDWRCIGYDHRGSGATVAPAAGITPQALVDDVFRPEINAWWGRVGD